MFVACGMIIYNAVRSSRAADPETVPPAAGQDERFNFWGEVIYDKSYDISIDFPADSHRGQGQGGRPGDPRTDPCGAGYVGIPGYH